MRDLQWFPGHMTAAMRMMEENLKAVDGMLMILDARAPTASLNHKLDHLFRNKKILYVLNKCDLVPMESAKAKVKEFAAEGKEATILCANDKRSVSALYGKIFSMLSEKVDRYKAKGMRVPVRVMAAGIPNTGKSTVINALCGGKRAATGNKAGVTRGKQWVKINDLELLDTPGTMPPAFDDQRLARHLAYIGCMNDDIIDFAELCAEFLAEFSERFPELLKAKYGIEDINVTAEEMMDTICVKRGFLRRGGEPDRERCAAAVIDDFRKGRTGKVMLD